MSESVEYIILDKVRVNEQLSDLGDRIERAHKARNFEYSHILENFKTELNLFLKATEVKDNE